MPTRRYDEVVPCPNMAGDPELASFAEAVRRDLAEQYWIDFGLAREIRQKREAHGWSQSELARRAGLRPDDVNRIESCKQNPTIKTVGKIAGALNMRLSLVPAEGSG